MLGRAAGRVRRGGPAGRAGRFAVEEVPLTSGGRYVGGAVVLAAKVLTESDAKGRIILPRAMVEHNLGWFVGTYRSAFWAHVLWSSILSACLAAVCGVRHLYVTAQRLLCTTPRNQLRLCDVTARVTRPLCKGEPVLRCAGPTP